MKTDNKKERKVFKEALKNEVAPLLIGLRNEIKESNDIMRKIAEKEVPIHELDIRVNKKGVKMLKGKDAVTPVRGVDYWTLEDKTAIIKEVIPVKGKDYYTLEEQKVWIESISPKKGVDYFTDKEQKAWLKVVTPKAGVDYYSKKDVEQLVSALKPIKGIHYRDGVDGKTIVKEIQKSLSPEEVRDKLESLKGKSKLSISAIKDLEERLQSISQSKMSAIGGSGGGSIGVTSFLQLSDAPSSYTSQGGKGVRVNAGATALEFYTVVDTDEKVKLSAIDATAGYLNDKIVAGNYSNAIFTNGAGYLTSISGQSHSVLSGLTSGDDHTQYALLSGRATPQQFNFGTVAGASTGYLTSTSHATKGKYFLNSAGTITVDELNVRLGVGTATPDSGAHIRSGSTYVSNFEGTGANSYNKFTSTAGIASYGIYGTNDTLYFQAETNLSGGIEFLPEASGAASLSTRFAANGNVGIGTGATVSAKLHVISTGEQFRSGQSTSIYWNANTAATTGITSIDATGGTLPSFWFKKQTVFGNTQTVNTNPNTVIIGAIGDRVYTQNNNGILQITCPAHSATSNVFAKDMGLFLTIDNTTINYGGSGVIQFYKALNIAGELAINPNGGGVSINGSLGSPYVSNLALAVAGNAGSNAFVRIRNISSYGGGATNLSGYLFSSNTNTDPAYTKGGIIYNAYDGTGGGYGRGQMLFVVNGVLDSSNAQDTTATATRMNIDYVNGNIAIAKGMTIGTAKLHLGAGTATASTAALKFDSGTILTTKEAGAVEFNGNYYFTNAVVRFGVGGSLHTNTTAVGNVGIGEDDLMTYPVPASTLAVNGGSIRGRASGTIANSINAKRLRFKFGATTILDTGAAGFPVSQAIQWVMDFEIIRVSATTQKCTANLSTNNASLASYVGYSTAAETLANAITLKLTGEGVTDNDVVEETLTVQFVPAPQA